MSVRIDASQLSSTVMEALAAYAGATDEIVEHAAQTAAAHAVADLNFSSPSLSGDYRKGWAYRKTKSRSRVGGTHSVVIYNKPHYRLTHLLENGHAKVVYGRRLPGTVAARPHIRAAEESAVQEFEQLIRQGVANGA